MARRRLDAELVRRGLLPSRQTARAAIEAGDVTVAGAPALKPTRMVDPGEPIEVIARPRFVGRGGEKLAGALERFAVDVAGLRALDAGSSTGGFTDCLLQAGAAEVVAVDVGRAQLHERIRADPRVHVHEQTDVREVTPDGIGGPVDVVVGDLSFISLRRVLAPLVAVATPGADHLLLVKPQFEAGKAEADRGRGVIRDPDVWRRCLGEVMAAASAVGLGMMGIMPSPITGTSGNVEFVAWLVGPAHDGARVDDVEALLDAVVAEAVETMGEGPP